MPELPGHSDARLIRGISRWALVAFSINLTVGAGILGVQGRIQALVGNYSIAVIVACGLLIALIGLCFAEVASRFDRSGDEISMVLLDVIMPAMDGPETATAIQALAIWSWQPTASLSLFCSRSMALTATCARARPG